ncbi:MAG: hypothetical protein IJW46_02595 [Clostridia bacterium]|nr:hypothetical protein [Clostridia bacterium]
MKQYRSLITYTAVSLFVLVFGIVYTHFGFGVTSPYMSYAFVPTALIALFFALTHGVKAVKKPIGYSAMTLAFFAASLTLYCLIKGIFAIAGAYSNYDVMLLYTAIFFGGVSVGCYLSQYTKHLQ